MKRIIPYLAVCVGAAPILALIGWGYWGEIRFYANLSDITLDEAGQPMLIGSYPHGIRVNTFVDDLESESIGRSYYRACRRLDAIRGGQHRRTYSWEDELTYPRMSSVVQYSSCYIEVEAYQGNDSDGVTVRIGPGVFLAKQRTHLRELPTDQLSSGRLRFQWR